MNQQLCGKPTILYFGNDWFAENRTSSHHVARWLAGRFRVYYIETAGLRAPTTTGRDLKRIVGKLWKFFQGVRCVDSNLDLGVRTLLLVPLQRYALVRWFNQLLMRGTLRWLMWREGIQYPILWLVQPHLPFLIGSLDEQLSVYYCTDDHAAFPHVNPEVVGALLDETTRKVDVVFVASDTLLEGKLRLNPDSHLSPHGVEFDHFARAQDPSLPAPPDVDGLRGPVIGFYGLIESWIDLELVDYLARARPEWTFVMIGRVAVPEEQVPRRPNVRFLGKRRYDQLPAYGKKCDALIIPYRLTQQVMHANPMKLREYLAMGKPVVSVSTPEIDKFADVVSIARSREEFLALLDAAVARPSTAEEIHRRMDFVASAGWDARMTQVWSVVNSHLEKTDGKARVPSLKSPALAVK